MRFTGLSDFMVYGLLFAAIVGFNILKQVLGARRDQRSRAARATRPTPQSSQPEVMESHWGRAIEGEPDAVVDAEEPQEVVLARELDERRRASSAAAARAQVARQAARSGARRRLFRTRGELRHGIVLMTVLGPCRALQPYDQDHG